MDAMEKLSEHLRSRPVELERSQKEGKKVVAYFLGDYVPTEIIHAAGAAPIGLVHGGDPEALDASTHAIFRYICPFARAQYGYWVLKNQKYFQMFDLLVSPTTCVNLRRTTDMYNFFTDKPIFKLGVPQPFDGDRAVNYFKGSLELMKEKMEGLTGNKVTDKKLREAIDLYRRMRDLLKKISELRKSPQPPITTTDFVWLNHAAHLADPKFMVETLDSLYQELSKTKGPERKAPRILVSGPNIAMGDYKVLDLIEDCGGMIVVEDIAEGVLFYWENVAPDGDPIAALTDRYLMKRPNCAFVRPIIDRHFDFIHNLAKDFAVDGVVWYQLRLCETWSIESYFIAEKLKKLDRPYPMLKLESEYDVSDAAQLKTRIETFVDALRVGSR